MYFTSKKWCKTQQLNKFNHYLRSNLHSMPPREFFFSSVRNDFRLSRGSLNLVLKRDIVVSSLPVAADSFVLNQFALRAPSAGFQRA